jgi:hypothetical protein
MRVLVALSLVCLACVNADFIKVYNENGNELVSQIDSAFRDMQLAEEQQQQGTEQQAFATEPETVYVMDQGAGGSYRVSGMLQTFGADNPNMGPINQLLDRPRLPFFDLSWTNWVDERLQILDLFQEMVGAPSHKCPHMQPEAASLDSGMVSYLASSRFGPAILTTYAQQFRDGDESDFDYETVYLPEGEPLSKSYQDASLLEDLSLNANQAFSIAERDPRMLLRGENLGFFGAKLADNAVAKAQMDGEFESLQPTLKAPVTYFADWNGDLETLEDGSEFDQDFLLADEPTPGYTTEQACNLFLFVLLSVGCVWVWFSLARSCCSAFKQAKQRSTEEREAAHRLAQKELLAPLMPEGAKSDPVEIAASYSPPQGTYVSPQGAGYVTVAIPLIQDPSK